MGQIIGVLVSMFLALIFELLFPGLVQHFMPQH
jgi:hypothetical protein